MAYDEQTFRRGAVDDPGENDPGAYRNRYSTSTSDYRGRRRDTGEIDAAARPVEMLAEPSRRYPARPGRSTRDRLGIHLGWEALLLLAVAAVGFLLYQLDPASLRRPALDTLMVSASMIGLLTLGAGLTLRAGVPNLAVGPIAVGAALHFAENGDRGLFAAVVPAVAVAAVGGLVVALVVTALHVPGWAATLAGGLGVIVYNQLRVDPVAVQGAYEPVDQALVVFGGFALLAVLGGLLGALTGVRRMLGRMRPDGDPALRRGAAAAVPVIGSLVLSSVFAVLAGVLLAAQSPRAIVPGTGLEWTGLAVGLALLAGTSAYGRRGGIFGTLLAVAAMALFLDYEQRRNFDIAPFAIAAVTIAAGLVITRLMETYGQPLAGDPVVEDYDDDGATGNWTSDAPRTWSPAVAPSRTDRWGTGPT